MSVRTNLSTRPFYNERAVQGLLALAALVVIVLTVLNASALLSLTSRDRQLGAAATADEARARELTATVARLRTAIDPAAVAAVAAAASEANHAIDRRTFSWTALFNRLEAALPDDVRMTSIKPSFGEEGEVIVSVEVDARDVAAIARFLDALEETGAFHHVLSKSERDSQDGTVKATLQGVYTPVPPAGTAGPQ
jgi:Tfp pilus assembly protein PilN